jgi:hypothetical protein
MNISESKPLCTPCHFRADGVFCIEGVLHYSQPTSHPDPEVVAYSPVTVEGEPVTCSACDGKGHILTPDGKQQLMFLETFARPLLRDLVDELFEEREHH